MTRPLVRRTRTSAALLAASLAVGCVGAGHKPAQGGAVAEGQVDGLALSALLIRDGHYDRAGAVLAEVDPAQEGLDLARYHTLTGLVALHQQAWEQARDELQQAVTLNPDQPMLRVYLAQAHYGLQDYAAALDQLERSRQAWADMADVHRLAIHCRWQRGDHAGAFAALSLAEARFPRLADLSKQRVLYLLELGLYQEAADAGQVYLQRAGSTARAHLTLGEALRRGDQPDAAAAVLEQARLRFPGNAQILVALSHAHLDAGRPRAAAEVMEEAARLDPKYRGDAAELYRRGGDDTRALYLNQELTDQRVKVRQRLGILLQEGALEQACALDARASRLGLLQDEEVSYALAYAHYRAGDLDLATERLRGITRPDLFRAATDLRKAIEVERSRGAE